MKKTVIFDLDGTLADIDIRRDKSLKPNGKLDWDIFAASDSITNWDVYNEGHQNCQHDGEPDPNDFMVVNSEDGGSVSFIKTRNCYTTLRLSSKEALIQPNKTYKIEYKLENGADGYDEDLGFNDSGGTFNSCRLTLMGADGVVAPWYNDNSTELYPSDNIQTIEFIAKDGVDDYDNEVIFPAKLVIISDSVNSSITSVYVDASLSASC